MKRFAPDYYKDFACIKGECRHSCCIGWEIDIDEDSLARFLAQDGFIGERLKENIACTDEGAHFILEEQERCPFLNSDGLCDLIIKLGEACLCQICDDHPRFRNFYSDREEIGLGLCCEAAAKLILERREPVQLELLDDDGADDELYEDDAEILKLRNDLISIVQNRSEPIETRVSEMLESVEIELDGIDFPHWKNFLLGLERLDDAWADELEKLNRPACAGINTDLEIPFEQLMVYLLYRHLNADDGDLSGRIAYCALMWRLLVQIHQSGDLNALCELARLYSSEIEYSDENLQAIIDEIHRLYSQI